MTASNPDNSVDAARERARIAREARAGRTRSIRRRVISGALALFAATWLFIAIVLISGRDPALSKQATTVASSSVSPTAASGSSNSSGSIDDSSSTAGTSSSAQSVASSQSSSAGSGTSSVVTRSS